MRSLIGHRNLVLAVVLTTLLQLPEGFAAEKDMKHAPQIAAAQKTADAWMQTLDAERYDSCWKQSSAYFQHHVPQDAFEKRMQTVRKTVDPMVTRTLNTAEYKTHLPELPKGEYVAFVWETVFSNSQEMLESLIMVNQAGEWKMIGYSIQ